MADTGSVVTLLDGSVGVVSEQTTKGLFRVRFPDGTNIETFDDDVFEILSAPVFAEGTPASIWPDAGTLIAISSTEATVDLDKVEKLSSGVSRWTARVTVPFWRFVLDNDERLQRKY